MFTNHDLRMIKCSLPCLLSALSKLILPHVLGCKNSYQDSSRLALGPSMLKARTVYPPTDPKPPITLKYS
ncbi:hypothetical protein CR513_52211, partial [Mucuna pruriens]